jgi:hypothetical protein
MINKILIASFTICLIATIVRLIANIVGFDFISSNNIFILLIITVIVTVQRLERNENRR